MTVLCSPCAVFVAFGWVEIECADCRREAATETADQAAI
jgi:hypothetical protein